MAQPDPRAPLPRNYMRMSSLIIFVSAMSLLSSCDSDPNLDIIEEETAREKFATLPGKIGITIKTSSGEWHYIIEQGKVFKVESLPKARPEAATILRKTFDPPASLPPPKGYVYWGAYSMSPDKRYLAASLANERHAAGSPGLTIVDTQVSKTLAIVVDPLTTRYIQSVAWSPDSQWVATLKSLSELSTLDSLLITVTGHSNPKTTWYLETVSVNGDVVARTKLADLRGSWGWVIWQQ